MPNERAHALATAAIAYLDEHKLCLTTAESCTAGAIITMLSGVDGCGAVIESGYVVYSEPAKKRLLGVKQSTIDRYTLTSEEVAREMAEGALHDSTANVVVATTGIAGHEAIDGIPPGTICYAWGYQHNSEIWMLSETRRFSGNRQSVCERAAEYAIEQLPARHRRLVATAAAPH